MKTPNMLHHKSAVGLSLWKFLRILLNVLSKCLSSAALNVNFQKSVIKSSGPRSFAIGCVSLPMSQESATQVLLNFALTSCREGKMIPDGMIKVLTDHGEAHRNVSHRQPELLYKFDKQGSGCECSLCTANSLIPSCRSLQLIIDCYCKVDVQRIWTVTLSSPLWLQQMANFGNDVMMPIL